MNQPISEEELRDLFTKEYGDKPPTIEKWSKFYQDDVIFKDPTQEKIGLVAYIEAQDKLIKRCDDIFLKTHSIAINNDVGFVEWTLGLKIMQKEFIYPGTTKLVFGENGRIKEHRDYFDFCGPTFSPVPILGPFIRWLYSMFVN
tara:strand:+ start:149 stop:580 length:432 start_codon:yes stop_codon:yes gene_type:complete